MNTARIGVAILVSTIAAYLVASTKQHFDEQSEHDRQGAEMNAQSIGDMPTSQKRANWIVEQRKRAFEAWQSSGQAASARIEEEIKAQEKEWAQQDERESAAKEAARKEQRASAEAAIQRSFYTTFALTWLLGVGVILAIAGMGRKKPAPVMEMQPGQQS